MNNLRITSPLRDAWNRPKYFSKKDRRLWKNGKRFVIDLFFTCRIKTSDDWCPNFEGPEGNKDEVQVSIYGWEQHYKKGELAYRVCVWGADDCGMERDYKYEETTPTELLELVLSMPSPLTRKWLVEQGFYGV